LHGHLHIAKSRDQDDYCLGIDLFDLTQPMKSFLAGGGILPEIHVEQNHIKAIVVDQKWDSPGIFFDDDFFSMLLQKHFGSKEQVFVVVDDEDFAEGLSFHG
jgi:hypothetical protein